MPGTSPVDLVGRVNYLGLRHLTEGVVGRLRPGASIVNFASVAFFRPQDQMAVYAAAKAGVAAFTQSLALELRDRGVRVNAVAPGMVRTGDNVSAAPGGKVRWVEMRQITDGVLFLASDAADAITGHVLPITNGAL